YVSSIRNPDENTANKNSSNLRQLMDLLVKEEEDEHEILEFGKEKVKISQIKRMLNEKENSRLKSLSEEITNNFQNLLGNKSLSLNIEVEKVNITYSHETKITDHDIKPHMNELASFDILSSGTGMQSLMILSILEAYIEHNELEKDFILIIEEPEVYLHPSLQRKMINVLKQLSQTNQILISTHSPIVVGQVNLNELVCIKKEYGKTIIMNNDPSFVIQELGIQPDDIFQHTKILFVEGPHDKILIESLIEKLEKSGEIDNTLKEQLQIVDVGGIKQMSFYANTRVLQVMNHTHHDYYNFWMMVDSDGNSAETVKRDILQSVAGISSSIYKEENIFVLSEYALESYFIDELILNSLFKDLDSDKIELICSKYFALYAE
ncbi:ATP-dependent nuclease, partial [Priestia megaterium]|uniref:ATP-dependent nuclease n=1 Tax=Priestia megaterium TaxID=1404 RepID=UPI003000741C